MMLQAILLGTCCQFFGHVREQFRAYAAFRDARGQRLSPRFNGMATEHPQGVFQPRGDADRPRYERKALQSLKSLRDCSPTRLCLLLNSPHSIPFSEICTRVPVDRVPSR